MFSSAKGEPSQFVVMTDVPARVFGTLIGVEQIGSFNARDGFQFLHP
jgi:hypothetical protein